ncbi:MAG: hypothetical protein WC152_03390 [Candidatus Izemoplasmatales bacterium]
MVNLVFLTDPNNASKPWEIVVAAILVFLTAVALFFLYRNVVKNFKQNKIEKKNIISDKEIVKDEVEIVNEAASNHPLLAQVNDDIAKIKEGDLRLFFAINLDNFRYIVDSYDQKSVNSRIYKKIKKIC